MRIRDILPWKYWNECKREPVFPDREMHALLLGHSLIQYYFCNGEVGKFLAKITPPPLSLTTTDGNLLLACLVSKRTDFLHLRHTFLRTPMRLSSNGFEKPSTLNHSFLNLLAFSTCCRFEAIDFQQCSIESTGMLTVKLLIARYFKLS